LLEFGSSAFDLFLNVSEIKDGLSQIFCFIACVTPLLSTAFDVEGSASTKAVCFPQSV
jgi:hypothetical protein